MRDILIMIGLLGLFVALFLLTLLAGRLLFMNVGSIIGIEVNVLE